MVNRAQLTGNPSMISRLAARRRIQVPALGSGLAAHEPQTTVEQHMAARILDYLRSYVEVIAI
jgi:hypothetical protein